MTVTSAFACNGLLLRYTARTQKEKNMAVLKAKQRKALPKSNFGLPDSRRFPMPDKSHAINAKARAAQMVEKGSLSKASQSKIDAKANKIIKRGK